jgi:polysaccharide pyruvyl transferase WcaK-like protein
VSGRYHHSIAAACLGTPLALIGNTPRMEGLLERLSLDRDAVWLPAADPERAISMVSALLRNPQPALVTGERLAHLRTLASRNLQGLQPPAY